MFHKLPCGLLKISALVCGLTASAHAQVVQLPSFGQTSFTGTVSVPDGGTASLGRVGYSASGSTSRGWGPYAGRAIGSQTGGVSLTASVQIIDLQAMDEAILGRDTQRIPGSMGPAGSPLNSQRSYLSGLNSRGAREVQADSPNNYRLALAGGQPVSTSDNESQVEDDIRYFLEQGKEAEKMNRIIAARVFYRMAVERMTPEMVLRYRRIMSDKQAEDQKKRENNRPDRIKF